MSTTKALITGASGQDGKELAKFLTARGYEVLGLALRDDPGQPHRVIACDMRDTRKIRTVLEEFCPDEIYNLAALSNVAQCEASPDLAHGVNLEAWTGVMASVLDLNLHAKTRLFQASSSEIFGNVSVSPQSEETPLAPRNVYGKTKALAHEASARFRADHDLRVSCGILYNHEGPGRGEQFVTRKITMAAAALKRGDEASLQLGNLDARRDWGHVRDVVRGMWAMLQHDEPGDYILATGNTRSVREFADLAFKAVDLPLRWTGAGLDETGVCQTSGRVLVCVNPEFVRPEPVQLLVGDASRARERLGWTPQIDFQSLVHEMATADLARITVS